MPTREPPAKNVIAVASGKGGVGKSTVAANLAVALAKTGGTVGFLDADLYGPSLPILFGIPAAIKPKLAPDRQTILPLEQYGIKLMSIGFLIPPAEAVIWRGPMLAKMLQQFLQQVDWGHPDYLVVDLPPGTGDIHLSLTQLIPLSGALLVTTPQDVALADVRRAAQMFVKTHVPLLGVVENMSYFHCPSCGTMHHIFGSSEGKDWQELFKTDRLIQLPLETATRESGDAGKPIVLARPESEQAKRFAALAANVVAQLKILQEEAEALALPSIVSH